MSIVTWTPCHCEHSCLWNVAKGVKALLVARASVESAFSPWTTHLYPPIDLYFIRLNCIQLSSSAAQASVSQHPGKGRLRRGTLATAIPTLAHPVPPAPSKPTQHHFPPSNPYSSPILRVQRPSVQRHLPVHRVLVNRSLISA